MTEGRGDRATGTPNTTYDLSSVLFHALEGGASYDQYIRDAEEAGDEELATFFIEVRDEDSMRAEEAQRLLAERTPTANERGGTAAGMVQGAAVGLSPGTEPSTLPPGTAEELPSARGASPPRTEPISAAPGIGDEPSGRAEEAPPPRPEPRDVLPGTDPIAEGPRRGTCVGRLPSPACRKTILPRQAGRFHPTYRDLGNHWWQKKSPPVLLRKHPWETCRGRMKIEPGMRSEKKTRAL